LAGPEDMKTDTTLTWNVLRVNLPTIVAICGVGLYVANGLRDAEKSTAALTVSLSQIQQTIAPLNNLEYRLTRVEGYTNEAHTRIDNLSNTMINNIDLIRRDVNRLTTQVEVLSSQIGMVLGDEKNPVQRRSRPGGPISVD
jgi:hypothetical protein